MMMIHRILSLVFASMLCPTPKAQKETTTETKFYTDYSPNEGYYPKPSLIIKPDPPLTSEQESQLIQQWGKWDFQDPKASQRPQDDYCAAFPNRDIPRDQFPPNAWQTDPDYLAPWLDQSLALVDRTQEAILAEYGKGESDMPGKSFEERSEMFRLTVSPDFDHYPEFGRRDGAPKNGGWSDAKSLRGLARRILHALVTNDVFHIVMGGHSAAAGHGNLFRQSYMMKLHELLEPVFGQMGVPLKTQNFGRGGLGTLQSSIGMKDEYGDDIDVILWDSGMTEGRDGRAVDMFHRQSLISGRKVPFLFGGDRGMMIEYRKRADADIGQFGEGTVGVPEVQDYEQAQEIPWAARFVKCSSESNSLCKDHKFLANCWVDRPDVTPRTRQADHPGSQVAWHPGFRWHQIVSRSIGFTLLTALRSALTQWKEAPNYELPDDAWHMTAYYENIQNKVETEMTETDCHKGFRAAGMTTRMCDTPMNARMEVLPRNNPDETSLVGIMKMNKNGYKPHLDEQLLYTGPDVHNPLIAVPEGEVNVRAIASLGRTYPTDDRRHRHLENIQPGLGWWLQGSTPGYCDGTYNTECGRTMDNDCLLSGHMDRRAGILFDSLSGWGIWTLEGMKEGLIAAKFETWHFPGENAMTKDWKTIDGYRRERERRHLRSRHDGNETDASLVLNASMGFRYYTATYEEAEEARYRSLKAKPPEYCDDFKLEFSINGEIRSWNKEETQANLKVLQRVVEVGVFLDDPNFVPNGETRTVEFGMRMTGCASTHKTFQISHLYWA